MEIENARCVAETAQAICVTAPDFDEDEWIPQSQIDEDSDVYKKGTDGTLIVSDWYARKKGWI